MELNGNNSLFASLSSDGYLKVWDVVTGSVRSQRPADLSDQLTCMSWCPLPDEVCAQCHCFTRLC
jgi:WD40 repeat protein